MFLWSAEIYCWDILGMGGESVKDGHLDWLTMLGKADRNYAVWVCISLGDVQVFKKLFTAMSLQREEHPFQPEPLI